jgi:hypothetical protein
MVFHRHIRAAIAGRGFRRTRTSRRHELGRRHRLNCRPNEEGKAGQDNEQSPEDQDPHVRNIRRSLPPFKVLSAAATGFLLSAVGTLRKARYEQMVSACAPMRDTRLVDFGVVLERQNAVPGDVLKTSHFE